MTRSKCPCTAKNPHKSFEYVDHCEFTPSSSKCLLLHQGRRLMRGESCLAGFFKCASLSGLASFDRVIF